jgi:hypothetical protein
LLNQNRVDAALATADAIRRDGIVTKDASRRKKGFWRVSKAKEKPQVEREADRKKLRVRRKRRSAVSRRTRCLVVTGTIIVR